MSDFDRASHLTAAFPGTPSASGAFSIALAFASVMLCGQAAPQAPLEPTAAYVGTLEVPNPENGLLGTAIHHGEALTFEVVNGWAVHGGDMVLGRVDQLVPKRTARSWKESPFSDGPLRRDAAPVSSLWPGGTIPYVIDEALSGDLQQTILEAINEFNTRTVITLAPRTTESDFVRFVPWGLNANQSAPCSAHLGRLGGEQFVWLASSCNVNNTIHEIGHAAGLMHEHQRVDRDRFVTVYPALRGDYRYRSESVVGEGPYDYASVMNYNTGLETIPPGMYLTTNLPKMYGTTGGLSSGDIDGIARMYGQTPSGTTISTNPAGLHIIVDGEGYRTPVTLDWSPGSMHAIYAPSPQQIGHDRFLFGRWNDDDVLPARRSVMADPEHTWLEANYIVQHRFNACARPEIAGQVVLRPESTDGYYVRYTSVKAEAVATNGTIDYQFSHWAFQAGRRARSLRSANVVSQGVFTAMSQVAHFGVGPRFSINASVNGDYSIHFNGEPTRVPLSLPTGEHTTSAVVSAPELYDSSANTRFRFDGWSDGGGRQHQIDVPPQGGTLQLNLSPEHRLILYDEDSLTVTPDPSDDGGYHYYPAGSQVQVTAERRQGTRQFLGWLGDASGTDSSTVIVMDSPKVIRPIYLYSACKPLQSGQAVDTAMTPIRFGEEYCVMVPPDAAELEILLYSSTPEAEVDIYVRKVHGLSLDQGYFYFQSRVDFSSIRDGSIARLVISRNSIPRMSEGVYAISLGMASDQRGPELELAVNIRRDGIGDLSPRILTYVASAASDPPPQRIQLHHRGTGPSRYRISSNCTWLRVSPRTLVRTGSAGSEISVEVGSAGLPVGMHRCSLTVVKVSEGGGHEEDELIGWEIPVFFSVIPSYGTHRLHQQNGLVVTSNPRNGAFYRAGERISLAVILAVPIELSEVPTLALHIGNRTRQAVFAGASGGYCLEGDEKETLRFVYPVEPEDMDSDGISISADALMLGGGGIQAAGNVVPIANDARHKVGAGIDLPDDHGDSLSDATELALSRPIGGEIELPGDADVFRLELVTATAVRIFTSGGLGHPRHAREPIGRGTGPQRLWRR